MTEVRKKFKKKPSAFQKAYFDAYNNPNRHLESLSTNRKKINELIISGKMTKGISDFFEGKTQALKDKGLI